MAATRGSNQYKKRGQSRTIAELTVPVDSIQYTDSCLHQAARDAEKYFDQDWYITTYSQNDWARIDSEKNETAQIQIQVYKEQSGWAWDLQCIEDVNNDDEWISAVSAIYTDSEQSAKTESMTAYLLLKPEYDNTKVIDGLALYSNPTIQELARNHPHLSQHLKTMIALGE